jgi:hypothetical protein
LLTEVPNCINGPKLFVARLKLAIPVQAVVLPPGQVSGVEVIETGALSWIESNTIPSLMSGRPPVGNENGEPATTVLSPSVISSTNPMAVTVPLITSASPCLGAIAAPLAIPAWPRSMVVTRGSVVSGSTLRG